MQTDQRTAEPREQDIVFVTGAARSGTTMLCRILGNHSLVLALRELHYFGDLIQIQNLEKVAKEHDLQSLAAMVLARQERDFWVDGPNEEELQIAGQIANNLQRDERTAADLFAATIRYLCSREGKRLACEQTPRNIFYAKNILDAYPNARIVHIMRDPRAVLASQKNRWQLRRLGVKNVSRMETVRLWFNYHPVTMTKLWLGATDAAVKLENDDRVMIVKFEDIVQEPDRTISLLCTRLGLEYEDGMLDVPHWGSSNIRDDTQGAGISSATVDKWRAVLTADEINLSERLAWRFMQRFGYERVGDGRLTLLAMLKIVARYPIHILGAIMLNPRRILIQLRAMSAKPGGL